MIVSPYGITLLTANRPHYNRPPLAGEGRGRVAKGAGNSAKVLGLACRRRVFAGQLRCDVGIGARRLLRYLLVYLQPGLASPGALQLVPDVEGEPPETVDLELDLVAVLKGIEAAVIGPGGDDVARLQGVDRGEPLDAARDLVRHVAGVEVLHQGAVVPQPDLQFLRVRDLVLGHKIRADRREGVARLHGKKAGGREAARRAVDKVRVAKDVIHRVGGFDVARLLTDHDREFSLALEDRRRRIGQYHRIAGSTDRFCCFLERVDRRWRAARAVFHVVDRHRVDIVRFWQWRAHLDG